MITYEKVLVLKNVPLFATASELALSDLLSVATEQTLKSGEVLIQKNQENNMLYLVLSGRLKGKNIEFTTRQMVGETTVFNPSTLDQEIVAIEKTTVLKWDADQLYAVMSLHPTLAKAFLGALSYRLRMLEKNQEGA